MSPPLQVLVPPVRVVRVIVLIQLYRDHFDLVITFVRAGGSLRIKKKYFSPNNEYCKNTTIVDRCNRTHEIVK
jgi:hypothetical protein